MGSIGQPKKWLITGASQGLGLVTALSALKAGHRVLAGARNPSKARSEHPELETAGGKWFQLDVTLPETEAVVKKAIEESGGIDVVFNNSGLFVPGNIEDINEEEMLLATSTNFFGPIRVLKGALPTMRAQKSGTIIYNSSIFGVYPCPAGAMYSSTKAAGDMVQETLMVELAAFNIRVITLNAGLFKTNALNNSQMPSGGMNPDYMEKTAIGPTLGLVAKYKQDPNDIPGDPVKFGERVVEIVDNSGYGEALMKTHHVFMGRDGLSLAQLKLDSLKRDLEASQAVGKSTDFEGTTSLGVALVADMK